MLSTRAMRRLAAALALAGALAPGCGGGGLPEDEAFGVVDPAGFPDASLVELSPTFGYYDDRRVEHYRTGVVDVDLNPDGEPAGARANAMYWLYREGGNAPLFTLVPDVERPGRLTLDPDGQFPIIDDLPDREDFSPFWEIVAVEVPDGYEANQIKSYTSLRAAADDNLLTLNYTGTAINCPVVDIDVELSPGASVRGRAIPRIPLWFRRLKTYCYLFEQPAALLCPGGADGCPTAGYPMPSARVVVGTEGAQDAGDEIARPVLSIPLMDLYFPRAHQESKASGAEYDILPPDSILTGALPGDDEYSPLARPLYFAVEPAFEPGTYTSLDDIDPALAVPGDDEVFFNIPIRGTVPQCDEDADCDDGLQPPLSCNTEIGFCDVPPRGYGEPCGPGIARCDHAETEIYPSGLACTGLRVQTTRYCYMRCDWEANDDDPSEDRDSRCPGVPSGTCVRTLRVVETDAGVCMTECNALAGAPESPTANALCEIAGCAGGPDEQDCTEKDYDGSFEVPGGEIDEGWDTALDGVIYDDDPETPPLDMDDSPFGGGSATTHPYNDDAEEPDGRMDFFEGQTCVTSVRDICAWPDSRTEAYDMQVAEAE